MATVFPESVVREFISLMTEEQKEAIRSAPMPEKAGDIPNYQALANLAPQVIIGISGAYGAGLVFDALSILRSE